MHPALWRLTRLYGKSSLRRLLRGARTVRGALVLLVVVGTLGFSCITAVVMTFFLMAQPDATQHTGTAAPYVPLALLVLFIQTVLGKGGGQMHLAYSPAEVDFLFAGPFARRDLLLFKLVRTGLGLLVLSLACSVSPLLILFRDWLAMFVGLTLALAFIVLASLAATLARVIVSETAHTRVRKAALFAATVLAAVALPRTITGVRLFDAADMAMSFRSTWPGFILLVPFEVFSRAMLAGRWFPDLLGWGAAGAAIDLGLLALVLRLDADYLEWSSTISQRVAERRQRVQRSGPMLATAGGLGRLRIPAFWWMGGAGPIAWRQLVQASRTSRGMIGMGLTFAIVAVILDWLSSGPSRVFGTALPLGLLSYFTFLFGTAFPAAFRGDLDHLDFLKTLPVSPMAMVAGEVAGSALVLAAMQLGILAIYAVATTSGGPLLAAAALALPVDLVLLSASNLAFLLYPVRLANGQSRDVNVLGRGMVSFGLQAALLVPLLGFAAGSGAIAYLVSGASAAAAVLAALVVLGVEAVPLVVMVGWAFDRFDPGTEMPC